MQRHLRLALALLLGSGLVSIAHARDALLARTLPALPEPVSNNAVASVQRADGVHLVSLMGLTAGKSWRDTTLAAWHLAPAAEAWRPLPDVPGTAGRLAGVAVGVGKLVYVFGGYTVAEDGGEVSIPDVHALDPVAGTYDRRTPMLVPVDDSVALVYRERYVYLVSGWHDSGNVNLVQRYDTESDSWTQATPWPGRPVFGHAGGIVDNRMVVCDGVGIETTRAQRRFEAVAACLLGEIDPEDPARIEWTAMAHHPGPSLYRMAATGVVVDGAALAVFAGGSPNPYNYDGIGYDGRPAPASAAVFAWDFGLERWRRLPRLPEATMDHRGLPRVAGGLAIVGGMRKAQRVSDAVFAIDLRRP